MSRGDGSGVRSPMAVMRGLGTAELEAEPIVLAIACLIEGVRDIGRRLEDDVLR